MNLVRDPWIPVVDMAGKRRLVNLHDAFAQGDAIADLSANPCQRVALMRLFICIAQAALDGPADEAGWIACRPRLVSAALAYLDKWEKCFNLFGVGAFLQVESLALDDNALADKLDLAFHSGNNPTLFDHAATPDGRVPDPAKLALDLLTYQVYSPGGRIGRLMWDGKMTVESCEMAPALEGSLLHTIIRCRTLTDTLHANLLTKLQVRDWGRPVWELKRMLRADLENNFTTYLGRLVPVTRAIRCSEKSARITLAAAISCPKLPEGREPMATVVLRRNGPAERPVYIRIMPERHPWRELSSVLSFSKSDGQGGALALMHLRSLQGDEVDIWTGGLAADKSKLIDMAEWCFSLPKALLDTPALARYEEGVRCAEEGGSALWVAIKKYAGFLNSDGTFWMNDGRVQYWAALDTCSRSLADAAADVRGDLAHWESLVRTAMHTAYEQACPHTTPRQIEAYTQGMGQLQLKEKKEHQ